jgi:hypothetical protein
VSGKKPGRLLTEADVMRAETQDLVDDIRKSLSLLRRHL